MDSGYGSLIHASSSGSASSTTPAVQTPTRPTAEARTSKGKVIRKAGEVIRESSAVPESAINYDALEVPFQDFSGMNLDLNFDEDLRDYGVGFGIPEDGLNMGDASLSAYLDARYCRGFQEAG